MSKFNYPSAYIYQDWLTIQEMSKLTSTQKEQLKRIILDTVLQRLTMAETQAHVKNKLGVEISIDYLNHIKTELKQDSQKELNHLRKNRFSYMNHLFFERADELKNMQHKLWEIITSNQEDKPDIAIKSISELHKLSNSLCQMYEMLPVLGRLPSDSFAGIDNDNNNTNNNNNNETEGGSTSVVVGAEQEIPSSTFGAVAYIVQINSTINKCKERRQSYLMVFIKA